MTYYLVTPQTGVVCGEYEDLKEAKKAAKKCGVIWNSNMTRQIVSKPWVCIRQDGEMRWVYRPRS